MELKFSNGDEHLLHAWALIVPYGIEIGLSLRKSMNQSSSFNRTLWN